MLGNEYIAVKEEEETKWIWGGFWDSIGTAVICAPIKKGKIIFLETFLESSVHFLVFQKYELKNSILPDSLCPKLQEPFWQGRVEIRKSKLEYTVFRRRKKNAGNNLL